MSEATQQSLRCRYVLTRRIRLLLEYLLFVVWRSDFELLIDAPHLVAL